MFEKELIHVHLCCNDPDNGSFAHRLNAIEIGPNMSFYAMHMRGPRLAYYLGESCRRIRIAGKQFPISGYKSWVGNWCWDAVAMRGEVVLQLLNWPRLRRFFQLEEAEIRLGNLWDAGHVFNDDDLRLIGKRF